MTQTIIEVFSFNYMGSTLLCGPFSKWPHFESVLIDFIWDPLGDKIWVILKMATL